MAKKKIAKGAAHQDVDDMSKSQVKAYNKEINEFYEEHGWRTTLSQYLLSPKQAAVIVAKTREKLEKVAMKEKAAKEKARADKKGAKTQKKTAAKKTEKKKAPPKPDKLKSKADKKAAKAKKTKAKANKKVKRAKPVKVKKRAASGATDNEGVLDFLLAYRSDNGNATVSIDTVIADLATTVRAA